MPSVPLVDNVIISFNNLRRRTSLRESLRSFHSSSSPAASLRSKKSRRSSYYPYSSYDQTMFPVILRDPEATRKLLEAILDSPNGKRSLSRLARTCRALSEPALDVLWRDLDSIVPILGLFPSHLLKKARRPGMGLAKTPQDADWNVILKYSERIRRISYDENANNVAASIFPILDEHRPRLYILPRLQELTWKAETPVGLDRCAMFLNPELRYIDLEVGANFKHSQISAFLADMSSRTMLAGFSFNSPTSLPEAFTELLLRQDTLEKVVLVAPGALSPGVGRWIAALPSLRSLQLDLTGRSPIAVEGFFDELRPRSGDSTPSSIGSTDSGVFSGEELDFTELRKSALRLTGDLPSKGSFIQMRKVHLTGEAANIAVFLKHLPTPLIQLDLVIEDPPDKADWQDLSSLICEYYGDSLQSLRISATGSSRFMDLVRSTSRAEPPSSRLSFEHIADLSSLTRLEVDLPESIIILPSDIERLAQACPKLEVLRLCPLARFPPISNAPRITLESLSPLTRHCNNLHTIAIVLNAVEGSTTTLQSQAASLPSLLRLHVGNSWVTDPLQVAILLSHLAPRLESLKWFQEKNRVGFNETNAKNWQSVLDTLPHLQRIRSLEKSFTHVAPLVHPETREQAVDATIQYTSIGVHVQPNMASVGIQCSPILFSRSVEASVQSSSIAIDATPSTHSVSVDVRPVMISKATDATVSSPSKAVQTSGIPTKGSHMAIRHAIPSMYLIPSIFGLFSFIYKYFISYPLAIPSRIAPQLLALSWFTLKKDPSAQRTKTPDMTPPSNGLSDIPLDILEVRA